MTRKEQAGGGFINFPASGLQSPAPACELRQGRRRRSGEQREAGEREARGCPCCLGSRVPTEHSLASQPEDGPWCSPARPPGTPPPTSVPLMRTLRLLEGPGSGRATVARTLGPVLRWMHSRLTPPRPCPRVARGPVLLHGVQTGYVPGQERRCPRLARACLESKGWGALPGCGDKGPGLGGLKPWACGGGGRCSAAGVDAEALDDVLAAQRASAQALAALPAAADVAAVEEDHLRLGGESGSIWTPVPRGRGNSWRPTPLSFPLKG